MNELIERLQKSAEHVRSTSKGGMEYEARLMEEAAAALEAAREDAERYRWLRCEAARHKAGDDPGALRVSVTYNPKRSDGNGFTGMLVTPMGDDFDAAIDQARGKGVE